MKKSHNIPLTILAIYLIHFALFFFQDTAPLKGTKKAKDVVSETNFLIYIVMTFNVLQYLALYLARPIKLGREDFLTFPEQLAVHLITSSRHMCAHFNTNTVGSLPKYPFSTVRNDGSSWGD